LQYDSGAFNQGIAPVAGGGSRETPITPKFGASFQYDDDDLYYVSAAKGYRVGGINTPLPDYCTGTSPVPKSYNSDSLWSYEIGAKSFLWNRHLQIDASAFHISWRNIQQPVVIPSCQVTYFANLGTATSNGFDLGLNALLGPHLKLRLMTAYTDAHYDKTVINDGTITVRRGDAVGSVPQVPTPWDITASSEYAFDVLVDWHVTIRLEDIFHSRNNGPFSSDDPAAISYAPAIPANPSTNVLNLRVTGDYKNLQVEAFVDNALDSSPLLYRGQDGITSSLFYRTTLRPRTIGLGVYWHF
jgi:outer membrane receptor protein involved in Fe transport